MPTAAHRVQHARDEPVVTTEVARRAAGGEREQPGAIDHEPGSEALDRARHRLERARVRGRVDIHDHDPGTARLGFASPEPGRDLLRPRFA